MSGPDAADGFDHKLWGGERTDGVAVAAAAAGRFVPHGPGWCVLLGGRIDGWKGVFSWVKSVLARRSEELDRIPDGPKYGDGPENRRNNPTVCVLLGQLPLPLPKLDWVKENTVP